MREPNYGRHKILLRSLNQGLRSKLNVQHALDGLEMLPKFSLGLLKGMGKLESYRIVLKRIIKKWLTGRSPLSF